MVSCVEVAKKGLLHLHTLMTGVVSSVQTVSILL